MPKREDWIKIPRSVLMNAKSLDDIDDWVEAHNPAFIAELLRIHKQEALRGKGMTLKQLKKEWNIP